MKLTKTELEQLLYYCDWAAEEGTYYGNLDQFNTRHGRIVKKLLEDLKKLDKPSKV